MKTNINTTEILCRLQYNFIKEVLAELEENKLNYVIVKGCPLAYYKTGNHGSRLSGDIDILLDRQDIKKASEILENNGFKNAYKPSRAERVLMVSNSHQILPFYKEIGKLSVEIDVNFDLFWGEYRGKRIPVAEFIEDSVCMEIFGRKIRTLSPLKMILQVILHHYKELNSLFYLTGRCGIKRRMFEDIYLLCKRYEFEISVDKLFAICNDYEIIPYAFYMFYYTKQVFGDDILDPYIDKFRTESGEELLNYYGLTKEERKIWKMDFMTRLDADVSKYIYQEMTERERSKLEFSKKLFGYN